MGGKVKAGPILTDNGNFIIDANFGELSDPAGLAKKIKELVGVVEVGLFIDMADIAYFGNEGLQLAFAAYSDGSVTIQEKSKPDRKLEHAIM
jgi:ribose 5-phosphate isomerase A